MDILKVENLVKEYGPPAGGFRAVDGISFTVPKGKIVGLLGPNGAGKTTTIHILLGITSATAGRINYFGKDFYTHRQYCLQKINFSSSYNTLQGKISVWENLLVFSYFYSVRNPQKKITDLLEYFEIQDLMHKKYWNLSAGQKTRVNLIKSLINDPELILMDEPTASLDPDIADKVLTLIEDLRKTQGLSILYTSHDMEEVTRVCDDVIFLDKGKIVAHDTPLGLTKRISDARILLTFDQPQEKVEAFLKRQGYSYIFIRKYLVSIKVKEELIPRIIFDMGREKIWITDIEIEKPTLEDVFLQIARNKSNEI